MEDSGNDGSTFRHYSITEANFNTWGANPQDLSTYHSSWKLDPADSDIVVGFQYFYCDEASGDDFTCYKFNPMED